MSIFIIIMGIAQCSEYLNSLTFSIVYEATLETNIRTFLN